jgi:replicative DNA helicase
MIKIIPDYFDVGDLKIVFGAIKKYYIKYNDIPDKIKLIEFIPDKIKADYILETIDVIYNYRVLKQSEIDFIKDTVISFVSHQLMKKAVIESMNKLDDTTKYPEIVASMENALNVSTDMEDIGTDGYDDDIIEDRYKRRNNKNNIKRVPTGFSELDKLLDGGLAGGELTSIIAPTKGGKSMLLVNIGANALLYKKNVLHITLEMTEQRTLDRYDMRLLGMTKEEIRLPGSLKRIKDIKNNIGKIIVKAYPEYSLKPVELEFYINKLKLSQNFIPDVIIVDYADIMAPNSQYNQKRFEIDNIYYNLAAMTKKLDIPIITATQANRDSTKRLEDGDTIDKTDVSESLGISRVVSLLISMNSLPSDLQMNKLSLYIAASRYSEDGIRIKLYADYTRCLIRDLVNTDRQHKIDYIGKTKNN